MNLFAAITPPPDNPGMLEMLKGGQLPFNWFDIAVVIILIVGFARGRKHGMSEELIYLLQWVAIIFAAAFGYQPLAQMIMSFTDMFGLLTCYVVSYVGIAIVIKMFFLLIKRATGGKLLGSTIFGGAEYYLGMVGGVIRFACILIFSMALIHARYFSPQELAASEAFNRREYGGDTYSGNYFPGLHSLQAQVFEGSLIGPQVKKYLKFMLIEATPADQHTIQRKSADLPE